MPKIPKKEIFLFLLVSFASISYVPILSLSIVDVANTAGKYQRSSIGFSGKFLFIAYIFKDQTSYYQLWNPTFSSGQGSDQVNNKHTAGHMVHSTQLPSFTCTCGSMHTSSLEAYIIFYEGLLVYLRLYESQFLLKQRFIFLCLSIRNDI